MKKMMTIIGCTVLGCILMALPVLADMDNVDFKVTTVGATGNTGSIYVLRGNIEQIYVTAPAISTGTVTLVSEQQTILSKAGVAASACFTPRVAPQTSAGVAATWTEVGTNSLGALGSTVTTTFFGEKIAVAGPVTFSVIGASTGTVTWTATVIFSK